MKQITGWGTRKLTVSYLDYSMDLPQGNHSEALMLHSVSYVELISSFLALPLVKAIKFYFVVTLRIGYSNGTKLKVEDNVGPLPSL